VAYVVATSVLVALDVLAVAITPTLVTIQRWRNRRWVRNLRASRGLGHGQPRRVQGSPANSVVATAGLVVNGRASTQILGAHR
jgi:hypothetical protein